MVISERVLPFSGEEMRERSAGDKGDVVAGRELVSDSDSLALFETTPLPVVDATMVVSDSRSEFCLEAGTG